LEVEAAAGPHGRGEWCEGGERPSALMTRSRGELAVWLPVARRWGVATGSHGRSQGAVRRQSENPTTTCARSLSRGFHWWHAGVGPTMRADLLPTSDFYVVHGSHQVKACEAQNLPRPRRGRLPGPLACLTAAARDCCESQTSFSTPPLSPVAFQKCKHQ
jgi:hypothetical protein